MGRHKRVQLWSPRITADLREAGWVVSVDTVAQVMRGQGRRPRAPDLFRRDFEAIALNQKWHGDGTEIPTEQGCLYLHTDRGSEFTAGAFRQVCTRCGVRPAMGRPGSALANVVIESWHSTVVFELLRRRHS